MWLGQEGVKEVIPFELWADEAQAELRLQLIALYGWSTIRGPIGGASSIRIHTRDLFQDASPAQRKGAEAIAKGVVWEMRGLRQEAIAWLQGRAVWQMRRSGGPTLRGWRTIYTEWWTPRSQAFRLELMQVRERLREQEAHPVLRADESPF